MNQINLPFQTIPLLEFLNAIRKNKGKLQKLFFQCEMRKTPDDRAFFGLVAYPGYRKKGKWIIGEKIPLADSQHKVAKTFDLPIIFGNMELTDDGKLKKADNLQLAGKEKDNKKAGKVYKSIRKQLKNKKLSKKKDKNNNKQPTETVVLVFEPYVTENPHVSYSVTLDNSIDFLNPCPPAPPRNLL